MVFHQILSDMIKAEKLLGLDITMVGAISKLIDNYGDLLLQVTTEQEIPSEYAYETFWNLVGNEDDIKMSAFDKLYNDIKGQSQE